MTAYLEDKKVSDVEEELPWLVFKLHNLTYTINSRIVTSIAQLDDSVTPVASAPNIFRGVINYRGDIIPLLDLRKLFGMPTVVEEQEAFRSIVEARKQEHIEFVNDIDNCIRNNMPFTRTFDPHACKLGRWCDDFKLEKNVSTYFVEKNLHDIEKPHSSLHEKAKNLFDNHKNAENTKNAYDEILAIRNQVILELDDMIKSYNDSYKEMIVIASNDLVKLGLIVDEVVAVDALEILSDADNFPTFQDRKFFTGIAQSTKVSGEILLVNEEMLMETFEQYKNAM